MKKNELQLFYGFFWLFLAKNVFYLFLPPFWGSTSESESESESGGACPFLGGCPLLGCCPLGGGPFWDPPLPPLDCCLLVLLSSSSPLFSAASAALISQAASSVIMRCSTFCQCCEFSLFSGTPIISNSPYNFFTMYVRQVH